MSDKGGMVLDKNGQMMTLGTEHNGAEHNGAEHNGAEHNGAEHNGAEDIPRLFKIKKSEPVGTLF
jgi:hypothetical protein